MADRSSNDLGVVTAFPRAYATDETLIRGVRRREPEAARALYQRFARLVNRLVWRIMGADQEHDDVVQEAFINVISSIGGVRDPSALEIWVSAVAVNTARREIRKRKVLGIFHLGHDAVEDDRQAVGSEQMLVSRRFYDVLDALRTDDRIVLTLRYVEGMELAPIASVTGCSVATVKRRIAHARAVFERRARRDPVLASMIGGTTDE